jgi:hypothetical protein
MSHTDSLIKEGPMTSSFVLVSEQSFRYCSDMRAKLLGWPEREEGRCRDFVSLVPVCDAVRDCPAENVSAWSDTAVVVCEP